MGVGPTKEKLLELIKSSARTNKKDSYKIEFQIDQENEIFGRDEECLDSDNEWSNINLNCRKIKEIRRFPYVVIGTTTLNFLVMNLMIILVFSLIKNNSYTFFILKNW